MNLRLKIGDFIMCILYLEHHFVTDKYECQLDQCRRRRKSNSDNENSEEEESLVFRDERSDFQRRKSQ
jgi:hypothetical protein